MLSVRTLWALQDEMIAGLTQSPDSNFFANFSTTEIRTLFFTLSSILMRCKVKNAAWQKNTNTYYISYDDTDGSPNQLYINRDGRTKKVYITFFCKTFCVDMYSTKEVICGLW